MQIKIYKMEWGKNPKNRTEQECNYFFVVTFKVFLKLFHLTTLLSDSSQVSQNHPLLKKKTSRVDLCQDVLQNYIFYLLHLKANCLFFPYFSVIKNTLYFHYPNLLVLHFLCCFPPMSF